MSWHFSFSAPGRDQAKVELAKLRAEARRSTSSHCPEVVYEAAMDLLYTLPISGAKPIVVTSHGKRGETAVIEVRIAA